MSFACKDGASGSCRTSECRRSADGFSCPVYHNATKCLLLILPNSLYISCNEYINVYQIWRPSRQTILLKMNGLWLQIPRGFAKCKSRSFSSLRNVQPLRPSVVLPRSSSFHSSGIFSSRKRNDYFSSKAPATTPQLDATTNEPSQNSKRKTTRSSAAKNSLRRVAVEAQRSRDGKDPNKTPPLAHQTASKVPSLGLKGLIMA